MSILKKAENEIRQIFLATQVFLKANVIPWPNEWKVTTLIAQLSPKTGLQSEGYSM